MRLFGSLAVLAEVSFFFMPLIRAQNDFLRAPPSGCGGLRFMPCFFAEARPLAFKPPLLLWPSDLCQDGVLNFLVEDFAILRPRKILNQTGGTGAGGLTGVIGGTLAAASCAACCWSQLYACWRMLFITLSA